MYFREIMTWLTSNQEINSVIQVKGTELLSPNFFKTYRAMDTFHKIGEHNVDCETCVFPKTLCLYFLTIL